MSVVCCLMCGSCLMIVDRWLLFVVWWPLVAVVVCFLSFVDCCLLFVVWCLLVVIVRCVVCVVARCA